MRNANRPSPLRDATVLALGLALSLACAAPGLRLAAVRGGALRISEVADQGDPIRRASTRLVLQGLGAAEPDRAISQYERAIKIDATNPYAYLALASYEVQWGEVTRGIRYLRQAELLLESQQLDSPRVEPHLLGLAGRARVRLAHHPGEVRRAKLSSEGEALLDRAWHLAPEAWSDGWLSADELR